MFAALVGAGLIFGPFDQAAARVYTSLIMLEFVIGAIIGTWWLRRRREPPRCVSAATIVLGFALLLMRNSPPLGTFNQITGAALVVLGALHPTFGRWKMPSLRSLGDSSYSLYLTHIFTLGALRLVWGRATGMSVDSPSIYGFMVLALIACPVVGYATWRWIETPLTKRLQPLGRRR